MSKRLEASSTDTAKKKIRMTKEQRSWCKNYERETGFEPLMDDFLAGFGSWKQAAEGSVRWFEDWSHDTMRRIDDIPGVHE